MMFIPGNTGDAPESPVRKLNARIRDLLEKSEKEFSQIGKSLEDFSARSVEISKMALTAGRTMAGEEIKGSIRMIREMVDQIHQLLTSADGKAQENLKALEHIVDYLRQVQRDLESLKDTAKTLRMLGLSTKVHSTKAGLDINTFMALGQDISDLSGVISSKSSQIISQVNDLIDLVTTIHGSVRELRTNQQQQASLVINGARNVLDSMEDLAVKSTGEAERISQWSRQISSNIADVVIAIQYQDITSQELGSVRNEMEGISFQSRGAFTGEAAHSHKWAMNQIAAARNSALQSVVVQESGRKLKESVFQVISSLEEISGKIGDMAELTSRVSRDSSLFLQDLGRSMSSVTTYLSDVVESSKEMSSAMKSLAGTVEGMSYFINDIQNISSEIELIALNARVRAAQTDGEGVGMGVIAGSIQQMAVESNSHRESLLTKLAEIARSADELRTKIEQSTIGEEKELDHMVRELGMLLDSLRYIQENVVKLLQSIDANGKDLLNSIRRTVNGISVHTFSDRVVRSMTRELEKIASGFLEGVPHEDLTRIGGSELLMGIEGRNVSEQIEFLRDLYLEGMDNGIDRETPEKDVSGEVELF